MDATALLVVIELINSATAAMTALQAVSKVIQQAKEEGRDVTLEELQLLEIEDDRARDLFVEAIDKAESA